MVTGSPKSIQSRRETGGSIDGASDNPAFAFVAPQHLPLPVVIAVPHAGRKYPDAIVANMRDPGSCQLRLEDRFVDRLGIEIARHTNAGLLVAKAPRAILDLNRSHDDIDWDMVSGGPRKNSRNAQANSRSRSGLGLIPRKLYGFGEIWAGKLSQDELDRRIEDIHTPYHSFLESELRRIRDRWGSALLIDLHSMPPLRNTTSGGRAPDIVIGDRFGSACSTSLIAGAFQYLESYGYAVAHNRPYAGGYVLDRHSSPARGIHAVQIEVCRSIYLDSTLNQPAQTLGPLAKVLAGMVREMGAEAAHLGKRGGFPMAAE